MSTTTPNGMASVKILHADHNLVPEWVALRTELWPECPESESQSEVAEILSSGHQTAFFVSDEAGEIVGFAEISLRSYVDGSASRPVGFLEGIYVKPEFRKRGLASQLVRSCEGWCRSKGCQELGSDAHIDNRTSIAFHHATGFREVDRVVVFVKPLREVAAG